MTFALLKVGLNPFDPKTVLLAKHAQHVVLIHFPIALFITAVAFDLVGHSTKRAGLAVRLAKACVRRWTTRSGRSTSC